MKKKTCFLAVYENELGTFSGKFADFECVCDDIYPRQCIIYF